MKVSIEEELEIPQGVQVTVNKDIHVKGPKGELSRSLFHPGIKIVVKDNKALFTAQKATKREAKVLYSFKAHLANMMKGVQEPWVYKLKICSGHFPMNVSVSSTKVSIKNFLGEKHPREAKLKQGVTVKVEGTEVTVESSDKELAGNTASELELLTKVSNRDLRIFQDGLYLIHKAGKDIE